LRCDICAVVAEAGIRPKLTAFESARSPHYLHLDGSTYVEVGDKPSLRLSRAYTLVGWIRAVRSGNGVRIVDKGTAGELDGFAFDICKVSACNLPFEFMFMCMPIEINHV